MRWPSRLLMFTATLGSAGIAQATTFQVGPTRAYQTLGSVTALVRPGDTVLVDPGTYREAVRWTGGSVSGAAISIVGNAGNGPSPVIDGTGLTLGAGNTPSALFDIEGSNFIVQSFEFRGGRGGAGVIAAGVRVFNAPGTTVLQALFIHDCDEGIASSGQDALVIDNSEIASNGVPTSQGFTPNLDLGGGLVSIHASYVHDSVAGQNILSRAHYSEVFYSFVARGSDGELSFLDSVDTGSANSNVTLVGNVVLSPATRTRNFAKFIEMGQNLGGIHQGALYALNDTFVAGNSQIVFVDLTSSAGTSAVLSNTVFFGSTHIAAGQGFSGVHDWIPDGSSVPGLTSVIQGSDPGFVSLASGDFHPASGSPLVGAGVGGLTYVDGFGASQPGIPTEEYAGGTQSVPVPPQTHPCIGALLAESSIDGGAADAGVASDAGATIPGGSTPPGQNGSSNGWESKGCGCGTGSAPMGIPFVLLLLGRRRRARSPVGEVADPLC